MKKFAVIAIVVLLLGFTGIVQAENNDPYFLNGDAENGNAAGWQIYSIQEMSLPIATNDYGAAQEGTYGIEVSNVYSCPWINPCGEEEDCGYREYCDNNIQAISDVIFPETTSLTIEGFIKTLCSKGKIEVIVQKNSEPWTVYSTTPHEMYINEGSWSKFTVNAEVPAHEEFMVSIKVLEVNMEPAAIYVDNVHVVSAGQNGVCGPENGQLHIERYPNEYEMCSSGTPTEPVKVCDENRNCDWTWECRGTDGGTTESCSAQLVLPENYNVQIMLTNAGELTKGLCKKGILKAIDGGKRKYKGTVCIDAGATDSEKIKSIDTQVEPGIYKLILKNTSRLPGKVQYSLTGKDGSFSEARGRHKIIPFKLWLQVDPSIIIYLKK